VPSLRIVFNEPVTGFDLADITLTRDGGPNLLTAAQTLTTSDGQTYLLDKLSTLTSATGNYSLTIKAATSGITDSSGQGLSGDVKQIWSMSAAPVPAAISPQNTMEGTAWTLTESFTDPDSGETWSATADWGDGSVQPVVVNGNKTLSLNHVFADNGLYNGQVTVIDSHGAKGTVPFQIAVANVAPTVQVPPFVIVAPGTAVSVAGSFTDPGADTWVATVDYGDNTPVAPITISNKTFTINHLYPALGTYNAVITVTDDEGGSGQATMQVSVSNPAGVSTSPNATYTITDTPAGKTFTVNSGSVTFATDLSRTLSGVTVVAAAGTHVTFNATQHLAGLNLGAGATASVASTDAKPIYLSLDRLAIDQTAGLDLGSNDLILHNADVPSVESLVARGFNNGTWRGPGIGSSAAASDATARTALGVAQAGDLGIGLFDGEYVSPGDVLVKCTLYGDADLNGIVNGDDESLVLYGLREGGAPHWEFGDFDYSTHVTGDDYSLFLAGLRKQPIL
jgi:hypothetical protein